MEIATSTPRFLGASSYASALRQELSARNIIWAESNGFLHECTLGALPSVLYRADDQQRHGNFHPASYKRILNNPAWKSRLAKVHTTVRKHLLSHDPCRQELDSCNSSDALLMSVFCHPSTSGKQSRLRLFLGADSEAPFHFGYKPRIPFKNGRTDCTEVDLSIGNLMIEAKLTEADFQSAPLHLVDRYRDFHEVFRPDALEVQFKDVHCYQLIRGILAAHAARERERRYCVICDSRRVDLIECWYRTISAVQHSELRCRLLLVTWQELAQVLPATLQRWLSGKYGIDLD